MSRIKIEELIATAHQTELQTWKCRCPNPEHVDKKPSCWITKKDNKWLINCFGCDSDLLQFVDLSNGSCESVAQPEDFTKYHKTDAQCIEHIKNTTL